MEYFKGQKGWIETVCGPMFSGKTEELMRRIKRMDYAKKNYVVIKPAIDIRFSDDEIVTHNNEKIKAVSISHGADLKRVIKDCTQAIVIDEVQFLDKSIVKYLQDYADKGLRVIVAGLDTDFRGEAFGVIGDILAVSEKITKLTAICACCGAEATRTQRIIDGEPARYDDPTILVGSDDKYEARCRNCHKVIK